MERKPFPAFARRTVVTATSPDVAINRAAQVITADVKPRPAQQLYHGAAAGRGRPRYQPQSLPPAPAGVIEYARVGDARVRWGLNRSRIYRLAAEGSIKLIKVGASTLIDVRSLRAYLESLPPAKVKGGRND